jgi:two-component sensor histidine kinase
LVVEDSGIGLVPDFNINKNKNLGLLLVGLMVSQLNGTIEFISGSGTKIKIEIPLEDNKK